MTGKDKDGGAKERKFIRVKYSIPVIIQTADMALSNLEGHIDDISAQGVKFDLSEKLYPGLLVKLKLKLKSSTAPLVGHVQWVRREGSRYHAGLKLDDSLSDQNDRVLNMITDEIIGESRKDKKI